MTPPRSPEPAFGPAAGAAVEAEYQAIVEEIAVVQGVINVAEGRLVELARRGLAVGVSGGDNLPDRKWLEWRAGIAPGRAADVVRLAKRADELPATIAALAAGELSLDQAAEVARYVPARFDESAARVASCCTVRQLRQALPHYRDPKPDKPLPGEPDGSASVSTGVDERGWWIRGRLPEAEGALVDQALNAMHEDLRRQARAEAPDGVDPEPVCAADALVALAETALAAGEAARPGTDRYLVHAHLEAGPDGVQLMTHLGIVLPDGDRRRLLCDVRLRAIVHDGTTPIGTGRTTRVINRRLRRAVEHRDGGCAVPGCGRIHGLEIHHIVHWEDGGVTETWNLIALCRYHHACHHRGTLGIVGNADLPRHRDPGVVFTNTWGHRLDPAGQPIAPTPPAAATGADPGSPDATAGAATDPAERVRSAAKDIGIAPHSYVPPTGERLDRWGFHLQEDPGWKPGSADTTDPDTAPDHDPPPPGTPGGTDPPNPAPPDPNGPAGPGSADPTRAGPHPA